VGHANGPIQEGFISRASRTQVFGCSFPSLVAAHNAGGSRRFDGSDIDAVSLRKEGEVSQALADGQVAKEVIEKVSFHRVLLT
jgi:hypothetical protein